MSDLQDVPGDVAYQPAREFKTDTHDEFVKHSTAKPFVAFGLAFPVFVIAAIYRGYASTVMYGFGNSCAKSPVDLTQDVFTWVIVLALLPTLVLGIWTLIEHFSPRSSRSPKLDAVFAIIAIFMLGPSIYFVIKGMLFLTGTILPFGPLCR